ncbi:MAG TPA: Crp/Fnr family transcriptional regulator [Nitrospiraceae bacterium]|nr:Crp/Fnr family transcriptional regulator [Nitrospiraceae bacterium]
MTHTGMHAPGNVLLDALPLSERHRLIQLVEPVALRQQHVLYDLDDRVDYVYFPTTCAISLLNVMETGSTVEVAIVGKEGMAGLSVFFGVDRAFGRTLVQVPGGALRVQASLLNEQRPEMPCLEALLARYIQIFFRQAFISSGCNHFHDVEQRIARWLLTHADRTGALEFPFTHAFLAEMIGVHRSTVTGVIDKLQSSRFLEHRRGRIVIVDPNGLSGVTCECYRSTKEAVDAFTASLQKM